MHMTRRKTVDVTPSWENIVPALIALIESGSETAKAAGVIELTRMAQIADRYVETEKRQRSRTPADRLGLL
jgi:hypothetical protein